MEMIRSPFADGICEKCADLRILVGPGVEQGRFDQHRPCRSAARVEQFELEFDRRLAAVNNAAHRLKIEIDPRPEARRDESRDRGRRRLREGRSGPWGGRRRRGLRRCESVDLRAAGERFVAMPAAIEEKRAAGAERHGRQQPRQEGNLALGSERARRGIGREARRRRRTRGRAAAARQVILKLGQSDRHRSRRRGLADRLGGLPGGLARLRLRRRGRLHRGVRRLARYRGGSGAVRLPGRRGRRPRRRACRRLRIGRASDRPVDAEILKLARPDRVGRRSFGGRSVGRGLPGILPRVLGEGRRRGKRKRRRHQSQCQAQTRPHLLPFMP